MQRNILLAGTAVCALAIAACSGTPQTLLSPTGAIDGTAAVNADGSTLKVEAPRDLGPNNAAVVSTLRPTLTFTNPSGRFANVGWAYEIELVNANNNVVYSRTVGESGGSSAHTLESDLTYSDNFWFRVRARLGNDVGPWSDYAQFRTLDRPSFVAPAPSGGNGGLPFAIPAECGPFGSGNRIGCVLAIAAQSDEWAACARGSGVGCHRFTRQVGIALAASDPGWTLIQAQPGGHACNCFGCGASDGTMFREDTVVYHGREVYDIIAGAGGPSPSLGWSFTPGPRAGDSPVLPAACP